MAWLTGWNRRKPKLVKGSIAGVQTDYQLKLTVYKGSGIDTIDTIYLGGYVNNDFSDLRFTSSDEITLLPYWIESYILGTSAIVWIKIDSIPADPFSKFIYIYYDNPVATTISNVNNTFVFFDDFESGTIDPNKWAIQIMYGSMGIRTDKKYGAYSIGSDQGPGQGCCYPSYLIHDQNHYFMKLPDGNDIQYLVSMKTIRWITTAWWSGCFIGFGGNNEIYDFPWDNVWKNYDIILKRTSSSNINYQIAVNGVWGTAANIAITQGAILPFGVQTLHYGPTDNSVYVRSDDFRVRKYASPEPIWDESSSEQTYTANLTVSSTPTGAEIWINSIDQGVTTTGWFILNPGTYSIILTKPGYEDYIEIITLESNVNAIVQGNLISATGNLDISSTPSGAEIFLAPTGSPLVDQGIVTPNTISLSPLTYDYKLTHIYYYDATGSFTITSGLTTTLDIPLTPLPCPVSPRYSGNIITLKATPKDGIGPYYVGFSKDGSPIDPSRLEGLDNPIFPAPENVLITRVYTLDDLDISSALLGTIDFSVYITDSCPTGAKICTETCTITIGCIAPVCNFQVT